MKHRILSLICCAAILLPMILSGCGKAAEPTATNPTQPSFTISLKEHIPAAVVDTNYDLSALVIEEDGVKYAYQASYTDPETGAAKELKVKNGKIIPKAEADISVTVTATRGEESSSVQLIVPISITADIIDKLLAFDGIAGQADVSKVITKEDSYLHSESSVSSLFVTFAGGNNTELLNLSHYRLQPYYSAQVWRNAAVSFWVYNPMNQDVSFKLTSYNPQNTKELLWDSTENTQIQLAKAGAWTNVVFSLYDMGITLPLFDNPTYPRDDSLKVCAQYNGTDTCTLYIDELDIVHADSIGLATGYSESPAPAGDYSDLLNFCNVYTDNTIAQLTESANGNGTTTAYRFGSSQQAGYPTFYLDFPQVTDISGFDYLKFDVFGENCYPYLAASIRYLDENGNVKSSGTYYDYYRNQWQTIYLNLYYLKDVDLTKAIGISFSVHMDRNFVAGQFNSVYFDNVSLYEYPDDEPQMAPATLEDNDIISGPFYASNTKPNTNGVCKVATDENGNIHSNSSLLFWTNNACGYPNADATFMFETEQDWSNYSIMSFDTHQSCGHYWLQFNILYLDENGIQQSAYWRYDTINTAWQTNHASLDWFKTEDGEQIKPDVLNRVVGFKIAANMAINVTGEVALIYFDNFILS